jgi:hypothetical protein
MEKKLSEMTLIELKALGYDAIGTLERAQQNLRIINAEIEKRMQAEQESPPELEE